MPLHFSPAEYQPYASLVQSIVTTAAIIPSAGTAVRGVNSWQRQMEASVNLEVKRTLLRSVYRLRNALLGIRSPFFFYGETEAAQPSPTGTALGNEQAWTVRWKQVTDSLPDVQTASVEAETLWGAEAKKRVDDLLDLAWDFNCDLSSYLRLSMGTGERCQNDPPSRELLDTLHGPSDKGTPDLFKDRLDKNVREIERFVEEKTGGRSK